LTRVRRSVTIFECVPACYKLSWRVGADMDIGVRFPEGKLKVGTKQTTKAVEQGKAAEVFVAQDADPRLVNRIVELCKLHGVKVNYVDTMRDLGKACGIAVEAAMAAVVKE
jgi:large subunit ribosomal protein L7A